MRARNLPSARKGLLGALAASALAAACLLLATCDVFKVGLGAKIDIAAPTVTETAVSNGSYVHGTITLSGAAKDDVGVQSVTILVNSGSTQLGSVPGTVKNGQWTASVDTAALAPSQEIQANLDIRVVDGSGKQSDQKLVLYFDNVVPVITAMTPSSSTLENSSNYLSETVAFTGSVRDGFGAASLGFTAGGVPFPLAAGSTPSTWKVVIDTAGNNPATGQPWFIAGANGVTVADISKPGSLKVPLTITATDYAGNVSTPVSTWFFVDQDAAAPAISLQNIDATIPYPNPDPATKSNVLAPGSTISARITSPTGLDKASVAITLTPPASSGLPPLVFSQANGKLAVQAITLDGQALLAATVSAVLPGDLVELPLGEYQFSMTASDDPALKLNGLSDTRTIPVAPNPAVSLMINNGTPTVAATTPSNGAFLRNFAASGTIDDGIGPSELKISLDGGSAATATLTPLTSTHATWAYSYSGPPALAEGQHSAAITGFDLAGSYNAPPLTIQFTIDTTAPTSSVQSVSPAVASAGLSPVAFADSIDSSVPGGVENVVNGFTRFKGTAADSVALKKVDWAIYHVTSTSTWATDPGPVASGTFTPQTMSLWTLDVDTTISPYVDGEYYVLSATATDQAGNTGTSALRTFRTLQSGDTPSCQFLNMDSSATTRAQAKLNLLNTKIELDATMTDDDRIDPASLHILIDPVDGGGNPSPTGTPYASDSISGTVNSVTGAVTFAYSFASTSAGAGTALAEGRHFFYLQANDDASWKDGKSSVATTIGPIWFAIDTAQPQIAFNQTGGIYVSSTQAISGSVSSANALDAAAPFTLTPQGGATSAPTLSPDATSTGTHSWSYTLDVSGDPDGPLPVVAAAKDEFGLSTTQSLTVTVDKTSPVITVSNAAQVFNENVATLVGTVVDVTSGVATMSAVVKNSLDVDVSSQTTLTLNAVAGTPNTTGNWGLDLGSLPTGQYTIELLATDKAGNPATHALAGPTTIDKDLPVVTIAAPLGGHVYNAAFVPPANWSGTASDAFLAGTQIKLDSGSYSAAGTPAAWTYLDNWASLSEGQHTLTVAASDLGGHVTTAAATFIKDTVPPAVLYSNINSAGGSVLSEAVTTITGAVSEATTSIAGVVVIFDKGTGAEQQHDLSGSLGSNSTFFSWSQDISSLPEGAHTVVVQTTDAAGNSNSAATPIAFMIDRLPPTVGAAGIGSSFKNAAFTVTGTSADSASGVQSVTATIDGGSAAAVTDTSGGGQWSSWSYSLASAFAGLAEGAHTLTVIAKDGAAHQATVNVTFVKDTVSPTSSLGNISGSGGSVLNETVTALTGTLADATSGLASTSIAIDGGATQSLGASVGSSSQSWSWDISALAEGSHTVELYATDQAGNFFDSGSVSFMIDRLPPTIAAGAIGALYKKTSFVVTGTSTDDASGVQSVNVSVDGGTSTAVTDTSVAHDWSSWSYDLSASFAGLAQGTHALTFISKDRAGHQASTGVSFVKDTVAPTQSFGNIVAGSNTLLNETVNSLVGNLADPTSGIASMSISIDAGATQSLGTPGGATNQGWSWDISGLADGTHSVEISAVDQAGNAFDSGAVSFRVDRQWPTIAIATPGASTVYGATGFGSPAGTATGTASHVFLTGVQYKLDTGSFAGATGTSSWTAALGWAGLSEGAHTLTVMATDAAGHQTTASATFTKDSLPPSVSYTNLATATPWSIYQQAGSKIAGSLSDASGVASAQYEVEQYTLGSWTVKQALTSLGSPANATNFSWNVDLSGYADGHYRLSIQSTDVAAPANTLSSGPYEFYVDTAAPTATISGFAGGSVLGADPGAPTGTGSDANLTALTLQLDSGSLQNILAQAPTWTYPSWSWAGLSEGQHTIALTATDIAGRVTSTALVFTKDTAPPSVTVNTLTTQTGTSSYVIQDSDPTLSGTLSDAVSLASWNYRIEHWTDSANPGGSTWTVGSTAAVIADWAASPAAASGTTQAWSVDISSAGLNLADGRYRILLHATDHSNPANQCIDVVREFRLDRSAPVLNVTAPDSQGLYFSAAIPVLGTATEVNGISAVKLKFDSNDFSGGTIVSTSPDASGNWAVSMPLTGLGADGQHIIYVEALSYTNKTSLQSVAVNIDRTVPTIAINSLSNGTVVTGNVTVSGSANDNTLLQSVQYKYGKNATGWTSMGSGNLYSWSISFPNINSLANATYATEVDPGNPQNALPGSGVWLLPIWAQATDAAGNTTALTTTSSVNGFVFYLLIQPSLDNPTVSLVYPADNAVLGGSVRVYGTALDNTWINGVQYAVDPTGTGSSYGSWQDASISGNLGPSINWYAMLNTDGSLNPSVGQQTRTVLVKVQATDAKVPPYTTTVHTSVPQIIHIVFNADVPSFNDLQVQSTSGTQSYATGEMVSGTFAVQTVVKTPVGLNDLRFQDLSPDANSGSILGNPSIVTPPTSKTITTGVTLINARTYLIVQAGSTNWEALGAAAGAGVGNTFSYNGDVADLVGGGVVYESDANNLFDYTVSMSVNSATMFANTTGLYQVNLVATDLTSPNPYMAQTGFTLQIDNYYPTALVSSSASLVGTACQIQGTSTDVGSGSGTISGIQKIVVYLTDTSNSNIINLRTTGGATSSGTTISAWDGGTRGSSPNAYIYPSAETAGSAHTYYASIDSLTEAGLSDATPTGNGDGFLESLTLAGNTYNWWAQIDSTKIPDGPVHVHYVVFDAAGNPTHYVQTTAFVANNGPAISSITLGTDLSGDSSTSDPGDRATFNGSLTGFTVRNSMLYFGIATANGNAPLGYSVKYAGTEYDTGNASSFTITNFASIPDSTLVTAGSFAVGSVYTIQSSGDTNFMAIGASSNSPGVSFTATGAGSGTGKAYLDRAFVITVSDSTPGAPQTATITLQTVVKNADTLPPTISVAPFGKTYAPVPSPNLDSNKLLNDVSNYSDNIGASGGHVEYAAASPLGDGRDTLSGQVVFHGKAWDDQRIQKITATIPNFNGGAGLGAEFTLATYGGSALAAVDGSASHWGFAIDASSQALTLANGHLLNWSFTWDSSQMTGGAATNEGVTFKVYDYGSNSGSSPITVDVVPYVTSIQRNTVLYNTNRSKYGKYPVMEGEAGIVVSGYNLPSSTTADANNWVKLYNSPTAGSADGTNVPTITAAGTARTSLMLTLANGQKSGWLRISVNGIEATNNKNSNTQSYNRQDDGSGIANTKWNDDLYLAVWNVDQWANGNAFAGSSNAQYPAFAVNSSGTLYGSWINYASATTVYNTINGSSGAGGTATNIFLLYDPPEFTDISIDPANDKATVAYIQNTYGGNGWSAANAGSVNVWTSDINQSTRNQLQQAAAGYYGFITDGLWHNQVLWEHYGVKVIRSGNNIHLAWYDDISKSVKYAYFSSTQNTALVGGNNAEQGWINIDGGTSGASDATAPGIGIVTNFATGISRTGSVGQSISLDVDKNGYPVISYYDNASHVLRLAYANSATPTALTNWKVQLVHPTADALDSYSGADSGDKNGNLTIKVNHLTGNTYLVAYRPSKGQEIYMKAADHGSGDFSFGATSILDASGNVGSWSDISIDTVNDLPTMVYENKSMLGTYDGVKISYWDSSLGSGGDWESMVAPAKSSVSDAKLSIAWNNNYASVPWQMAVGFKSDQFRVMYLQKTN